MSESLPIAVRVYPDLKPTQPQRMAPQIDGMLVFDCETRTDKTQALTFGSYRFLVAGRSLEEGLFYADDLGADELAVLEHYTREHTADTDPRGIPERGIPSNPDLMLLPIADFRTLLYRVAYKGRGLLVAFNFPFDVSRCALGYVESRDRFLGGFTFQFFQYRDRDGQLRAHPYRPGIAVKHMDSKRALKGFTGAIDPDKVDQIPEGQLKPKKGYVFRGHMLDLRTLAFALTDRSLSLEGACELFGVEHGKQKVEQHGIITPEYIDYNRRDVLASTELAAKLLAEYALHPIELQVTKAYSPASIGKAYLQAMGVTPIMQRMPDFPKRYCGYAESAFFGGRASAHVRKVPVPVVYTDFLSQYSTVNVLMGLWRFVTASEIRVIEDCREELAELLRAVTPEWVLDASNCKRLAGFARIVPDGGVLPLRAKYRGKSWQIGVNYVHASSNDPADGLWYAWPDLVASVLLTGKLPHIVEAFRLAPIGKAKGLKKGGFRGQVPIDPRSQDFFKAVIEERARLAARTDLSEAERDRRAPRAATSPLNALRNYLFACLESEARLALLARGLDPTMGVLHADQRNRDSLALDAMEPVRADVDAFLLDLLEDRTFTARDFGELPNGICRIAAPLTHELALTLPHWRECLRPIAARLAQNFRESLVNKGASPRTLAAKAGNKRRSVPGPERSPLLATPRKASQPHPYATRAWRAPTVEACPANPIACALCGGPVLKRRRRHCEACIPKARREHGLRAIEAARKTLATQTAAGNDPRRGADVNRARGEAISEGHRRNRSWSREHPGHRDEAWFKREITPKLDVFTLKEMGKATGLSLAACSRVRSGAKVPHPRHWDRLLALVEAGN